MEEDQALQDFLDFLSTSVDPLIHGEHHVRSVDTREPIEYDYHMPPGLQPEKVTHNPAILTRITENLISTLNERKTISNNSMDVDTIKQYASFQMRNLVGPDARGEGCVKNAQTKIHGISCLLATLSCFDIENDDIIRFHPVFGTYDSTESNTKADLLVGCEPRHNDKPEKWSTLGSSLTLPKDLRDPYFHTLYTEEYKNIRTGSPRAILGIYIIIWCLHKGYLESFWPKNECEGCATFRKSHRVAEGLGQLATSADDADSANEGSGDDEDATGPTENAGDTKPLDAPTALPGKTQIRKFKQEIHRLLELDAEYNERYKFPVQEETTAKKPALGRHDSGEIVQSLKSYKHLLNDAMRKACTELKFSDSVKDGLIHWVLNAAYMLIQVWAHMVRHNGTVARLTCHNIGVILTRHRETQTMGVSDFFEYSDTPILQTTALTVYAYHDAVERHDEHLARGVPLWIADPYRGETLAEQKLAGQEEQEDEDTDSAGGGGGGDGGGGGAGNGGSDGSEGGDESDGAGGGPSGGRPRGNQEQKQARQARYQRRGEGYQTNINLDTLHLAFRAPGNHLWSNGFSHFRRVGPKETPASGPVDDLTPREQDNPPAAASVCGLNPKQPIVQFRLHQRPSLFSEDTSSVPTSPSTTGSFPGTSSRGNSPFPEKATGQGTGSDNPTSATVCNAGILIDSVLGESAVGVVWSGKMILEDGTEDDELMPVAVKMAILRETVDGDAREDERESVRHEALVYEFLAKSGKLEISPHYYGVFEDRIGTVALILDNGGTALKTFDNLTRDQAQTLFAKAVEMHSVGILHNDLVPRNIVTSPEGELRIIDFHIAGMHHHCAGKEKCKELLKFGDALGL